jgi:hypothetical protein
MHLAAPRARRARRSRGWRVLLLALVVLIPLHTGCSVPGRNESEAPATPERRDPTEGDLVRLRREMSALPHVTGVDLNYKPRTFGYEAMYFGVITSDSKDPAALIATADKAYRIVWTDGDLEMGALDFYVKNPTTGKSAGALDLGMTTPPLYEELERRYGSRPSPSATPGDGSR